MSLWQRDKFPSITDHIRAIVREEMARVCPCKFCEKAELAAKDEPRGPYGPPQNPAYAPHDDELSLAVRSLSF